MDSDHHNCRATRRDFLRLSGAGVAAAALAGAPHGFAQAGVKRLRFAHPAPAAHGWNVWWQLLGFPIFFIASTAEINRAPFDLVEADSEIVAGPFTEYSGMRFGFFFFAEYLALFIMSGVMISLFFGGWLAPWPFPAELGGFVGTVYGVLWFFVKTYIFVAVAVLLRATR